MPETRPADSSAQAYERSFAPAASRRGPARRILDMMRRLFRGKKKTRKKGHPNIYPLY